VVNPGGPAVVGDGTIEPHHLVLRRIPPDWVVPTDEGDRPSSQAFGNNGDDDPMSGYLDQLLAPNDLQRRDIVDGHDGFLVAALKVSDLTDQQQVVQPDPIVPVTHCCDPAHAKVVGQKNSKRRKRLAATARWLPGLGPGSGPYLESEE
jgi:hypothetical protein